MVDAEALAQHAADFDRKTLVAPMIGEKAFGLGQQFHDQRMAALVISNEARHEPAQRWNVARQFVTGGFALQRQHGVGLHVAHLLDEETGRAVADNFEIAIAAARVDDRNFLSDDFVGAEQSPIHQEIRQIGGGQMHAALLSAN